MQFNLYATFRLLAGSKSFNLNLPDGISVRQAVQALVDQCPVLRPHWVDEAGDLHAHVHVFINGQDVQNLDLKLDTPLKAADVLDFFPPVGGGRK